MLPAQRHTRAHHRWIAPHGRYVEAKEGFSCRPELQAVIAGIMYIITRPIMARLDILDVTRRQYSEERSLVCVRYDLVRGTPLEVHIIPPTARGSVYIYTYVIQDEVGHCRSGTEGICLRSSLVPQDGHALEEGRIYGHSKLVHGSKRHRKAHSTALLCEFNSLLHRRQQVLRHCRANDIACNARGWQGTARFAE